MPLPPLPLSSATSMPNFLAALRIAGMALSPNGDCGARESALRAWSASWTGKCRSDRGSVRPDASFLPPGSMYANALSGRSLMDAAAISARATVVTDDLPVAFWLGLADLPGRQDGPSARGAGRPELSLPVAVR